MQKDFSIRHKLISSFLEIDVKGVRRVAHHLPHLLIPAPTGVCTIKTNYGFYLQIDPVKDQGVERSIYYTGTYEKGSLAVLKKLLRSGDSFADVGANIGLMSIYASQLVGIEGKVWAFEPNPETARILKENVALNKADNIETSSFAVGKVAGNARIYDRWDFNRGSATLVKPEGETNSYEIEVTTLSTFFQTDIEKGAGLPDLIKLDIEGFELEALEGALDILKSEFPPMLMIECSERRVNSYGDGNDPLYDFLNNLGRYRIFKGRKDKSRISKLVEVTSIEELPAHDNIYCLTAKHMDRLNA